MKPKNGSTVLMPEAVMVRERGEGAGGGEPRKHFYFDFRGDSLEGRKLKISEPFPEIAKAQ